MKNLHQIKQSSIDLAQEIWKVYWYLVKIIIPVLIAVKLLDSFGATEGLASIFAPAMSLVGLPDIMGLVLATAVLTNMYTAFAVFLSLPLSTPLSVAEVSVLGSMMLIAHSLPVEGAIAKSVGLPWKVTITLRIGCAFMLGGLLHFYYQTFDLMQQESVILWQPKVKGNGLEDWLLIQSETLIALLLILSALMLLLRVLKYLGIEKWIHFLLVPLLKFLGLSKEAANVTVIGTILGLTFGGGLLIQESKKDHISKKDILISMMFLSICHSLIDDTLVTLLLGADIVGVLWIRVVFALILIAVIVRLPITSKLIANRATKLNLK